MFEDDVYLKGRGFKGVMEARLWLETSPDFKEVTSRREYGLAWILHVLPTYRLTIADFPGPLQCGWYIPLPHDRRVVFYNPDQYLHALYYNTVRVTKQMLQLD